MADALVDKNVPPFQSFLDAITLACLHPKRILLQTSRKNYRMRLGRVRTPLVESDPQPQHLAPNFHYHQESLPHEFRKNNPETSWKVARPAGIIGAIPSTAMNIFYTFGVYAAVQAAKGQPLVFGGDWSA